MQKRSSSSPYTYTPVTDDLVRLSAEIEGLTMASSESHSNALVGVSEVSCRICGRNAHTGGKGKRSLRTEEEDVQAIKGGGSESSSYHDFAASAQTSPQRETRRSDTVAIRDPRAPSTATLEDAIRRYKVTHAFSPWSSQESVYQDQGKAIADWLWKGFSATLVSFGQQGTGKSYTLFNDGVSLSFPQENRRQGEARVDESCGVLVRVLDDLFHRISSHEQREGQFHRNAYKVGISCWEILGNKKVDLLKPFSAYTAAGENSRESSSSKQEQQQYQKEGEDYVTVEIANLSEARAALNHSRASSTNWYVDPKTRSLRTLPNRSHSFIRVVIFDCVKRCLTCLHVVDLVGSQSLTTKIGIGATGFGSPGKSPSSTPSSLVPRDLLSEHERERKGISQQLLAFSRLVGEIAQQSDDQVYQSQSSFMASPSMGSGASAANKETKRLVHLSARETKLTRELAPMLAGSSRCFLLCTVSRSSADYIDTANTLRVATKFSRIVNACNRQVLSVDPREISLKFQQLDSILSIQQQMQDAAASRSDFENLGREMASFHEGSRINVPKNTIMKNSAKKTKGRSTAEVIHMTLSQVENIEQVANQIMETTKQVDQVIEESLSGRHGGGDEEDFSEANADEASSGMAEDRYRGQGQSVELNLEKEGSYYSSMFPEEAAAGNNPMEVSSSYQDPILSGAVQFIHSSSSSSSGSVIGRQDKQQFQDTGSSGHRLGKGLNDAARDVAMQRLRELKSQATTSFDLHSPLSSDSGRDDYNSNMSATKTAATDISVSSSVKSVETQRKLDSLKQSFRSMYTELELPMDEPKELEMPNDAPASSDRSHSPRGPIEVPAEIKPMREEQEQEQEDEEEHQVMATSSSDRSALPTLHHDRDSNDRQQKQQQQRFPPSGFAFVRSEAKFDNDNPSLDPRQAAEHLNDEIDSLVKDVGGMAAQQEHEELERAYDALLKMLEREREAYNSEQQKVKVLERDLLESQHTVGVQVDGLKLENLHLRSRCRQLEEAISLDTDYHSNPKDGIDMTGKPKGLLGEVFEQLENEVDRLQGENLCLREDLKQANLDHAETVALVHKKMEGLPAADDNSGDSGDGDSDVKQRRRGNSDGDNSLFGDSGDEQELAASLSQTEETKDVLRAYRKEQREQLSKHQKNKLQVMTRRMRKLEEDLHECRSELATYRKNDRKYAIHKRGIEETIKRIAQLQKQLEGRNQELVKCQLKFAESEGKCYTLAEDHKKMEEAMKQMAVKVEHSEGIKRKYAEQLQWARKQVTRDSVLSKLPPLPSGVSEMDQHRLTSLQARKIQSTAGEICRRIRREPGISPRVENMLDRLTQEIGLHVQERVILARREALLLQMITGEPGMRRR